MAEEMVTWIDDKGNILGPIPISQANSDPKYLHLEVAVLIVDDLKRVLLQQRALSKKVAPGVWTTSAAGHVTFGDTVGISAHRELSEEMGIDVDKLIPMLQLRENAPSESHITHWYIGKYHGGAVKIEKTEVAQFAWVDQDQFSDFAKNNILSKHTIEVVARYWAGEWDKILL